MQSTSNAWQNILFREARTANQWQPRSVPQSVLRDLYELIKFGPTSMNCSPLRIVFVTSSEGKEALLGTVSPGNVEKTRSAPVTAVLGYDLDFHNRLPMLFPHSPTAREWFAGNDEKILDTAFRNSSLQAGYFILAARGLGLDCGPLSGFDPARVEAEYFPDGRVKANFLCNLGYAERSGLFGRSPRLSFEDACTFR